MRATKVQTIEQPRRIHSGLAMGAGAALGALGAYVVPAKGEFKGLFNKTAVDTFVSKAAMTARAEKRSILKYMGIGAAVALGASLLAKAFSDKKAEANNVQYSKWDAIIDSSDYACMVTWYNDSIE